MIRVTANVTQVAEAVRVLGQRAPYAIVRGINRTAVGVRREMISILKRETVSKSSFLTRAIRIRPRASLFRLRTRITGAGHDIPIIKLGARQLKGGGVSWHGRGKFPAHLPNAFIATLRGGNRQVLIRSRTSGSQQVNHLILRHRRVRPSGSDLPIAVVVTRGISQVLTRVIVLRALERRGDELFARYIVEELNRELSREGFAL